MRSRQQEPERQEEKKKNSPWRLRVECSTAVVVGAPRTRSDRKKWCARKKVTEEGKREPLLTLEFAFCELWLTFSLLGQTASRAAHQKDRCEKSTTTVRHDSNRS